MSTKLITATFTPGTSYAAGNNFGGKLTFQTGFIGNPINVQVRRVNIAGSASTLTASANLCFYLFNANPSTTFTDAASPTWSSSDNAKASGCFNLTTSVAGTGQIANTFVADMAGVGNTPIPITVPTDGSGNIYGVLQAGGTWTMTTPAAFTVTLEIGF